MLSCVIKFVQNRKKTQTVILIQSINKNLQTSKFVFNILLVNL